MSKRFIIFLLLIICMLHVPVVEVEAQGPYTIVFDYSHGQYSSYLVDNVDAHLAGNLTAMGHNVIWAMGGINSTILTNADAFIAGSQYGETTGYTAAEYTAIANWFNTGNKFMWVGYDSDYYGNSVITNMTGILEGVNSHVYGEPLSIEDPESNCDAAYRAVANETSNHPFVADIILGVDKVLMHGPTLLYGSPTATPETTDAVALETTVISNVYPFLFYSAAATIVNSDLIDGFAHIVGEVGSFVAATIEVNAGTAGTGVIVVSGASPYGDYQPMYQDFYKDVELNGYNLVDQAIVFGMDAANSASTTTAPTTTVVVGLDMQTVVYGGSLGIIGLVIVSILVLSRRRKPKPIAAPHTTEDFPEPMATTTTARIETLRGCEVVGGQFHYKVKVKNDTGYVINNVTVNLLAYPKDCMVLEGSQMKSISRIEPNAFRSPEFVLSPTKDCVEGQIIAVVSYIDYQNKAHTVDVEPYTIRSVCDLLKPLESTVEQFDDILSGMDATSERFESDQNPRYLFSKTKTLLPEKNFSLIEASSKTIGGEFSGTIRGFAEGKYTGQKVAVQILISGVAEGNKSMIIIEGLGDDIAMVPTAVHEISQQIGSWTCVNCGGMLDVDQVDKIRKGIPVTCQYCKQVLTIEQYH